MSHPPAHVPEVAPPFSEHSGPVIHVPLRYADPSGKRPDVWRFLQQLQKLMIRTVYIQRNCLVNDILSMIKSNKTLSNQNLQCHRACATSLLKLHNGEYTKYCIR